MKTNTQFHSLFSGKQLNTSELRATSGIMSELYTHRAGGAAEVLFKPNRQCLLLCGNSKYVLLEKSCKMSRSNPNRLIKLWNHLFLLRFLHFIYLTGALAPRRLWDLADSDTNNDKQAVGSLGSLGSLGL